MDEQSDECDEKGGRRAGAAPVLTTRRLILRAPRAQDAPAIAAIANNRRIAEQTRRMPHPYSQGDALEWVAAAAASEDHVFLVTRRTDGAIMGAAGCAPMDETDMEIGYWIGQPFWGQGFATEAAQAIIDDAFASRPHECLYGRCRVVNGASRRVLMKCGFQLAGAGMCDSRVLNGVVPVEEFVLERSVWQSLKRWGKAS